MAKKKTETLLSDPPPVEEASDAQDDPRLDQSDALESYPVDADLWRPINAAFCALCTRHGLEKGYQRVSLDRATGSFVIHERPSE